MFVPKHPLFFICCITFIGKVGQRVVAEKTAILPVLSVITAIIGQHAMSSIGQTGQKVVKLFSAQKDGLSIADVEKAATDGHFFKLSKKEFDQMDTDQDGRLTFDEAMHGVLSEAKKVDTDGDGKISKKEFSKKSVEQ
uniref:EF-hand domain-containing protein n=1 Tax=Globodera pallida TaxID=36090 RepID=A0A183C9D8_GLOPA